MNFKGANFNVAQPHLFDHSMEGIRKSLTTPDHFFCSDNVITWNRNLSFLQNNSFMECVRRNSNSVAERAIVWRTYILCYFAKFAARLGGDFVEVGAYKGNTANIILEQAGLIGSGNSYYLYDAFEHTGTELNPAMPEHGAELYGKVRDRFAQYDFVKVIKGYVPESFQHGFPERIAFAHVDLNQAPAEVGALKRIIPALLPGGVIVLDDYGWWGYREQKEAEDPLFAEHGLEVLELPTGQGVVLNNL